MNWTETIFGLAIVLIGAMSTFILSLPPRKGGRHVLRPIVAFQRLKRAIGLAVEDGTRLHVSIGKASVISPSAAASLTGLATLERVAQLSLISDRPPTATSGDGSLSLLSQDTLRAAYRIAQVPDQFDPDRGRLGGPTPLSYTAGTLPVMRDERVSANLLVGNFGPEVALMAEAAERSHAFTLMATDSLPAQAALYASAGEALIGEEVFATPAYMQSGPAYIGGLRAQDVLRWVVIALMIVLAALRFLGIEVL